MKTYKHKTQRTRNAQLTYYSIIKTMHDGTEHCRK